MSAPLLQPLVNKPWLDDSDVPTFIASTSSPYASGSNVPHPPTPDTFFLATPLELIRHEATPPRFHLRMRPSSSEDILNDQMTTPSPVPTNGAPQANQVVTPTKRMEDLAVTKDLTASMMQPKIVTTKKRKTMRRNASFNALCA